MTSQRWNRLHLLILGFTACAVGAMVLSPVTFSVHVHSAQNVTFKEGRVIRYGYSRLHSRTYVNAMWGYGEVIEGRCFIDVITTKGQRRVYGWRLTLRTARGAERKRWIEIN